MARGSSALARRNAVPSIPCEAPERTRFGPSTGGTPQSRTAAITVPQAKLRPCEGNHRAGLRADGADALPSGARRARGDRGARRTAPSRSAPRSPVRTGEATLGPDEPHAPVESGQVTNYDARPILRPFDHSAGRTPCRGADRVDPDQQLPAPFGHRSDVETGRSQQRVIELSTTADGGVSSSRGCESPENGGANCRADGYMLERGQLNTGPRHLWGHPASLIVMSPCD